MEFSIAIAAGSGKLGKKKNSVKINSDDEMKFQKKIYQTHLELRLTRVSIEFPPEKWVAPLSAGKLGKKKTR